MNPSTSQAGPRVPSAYVNLLVDVVARWNIPAEQLLAGSGVSPEDLLDIFWELDFEVFAQLVKRALELTGEPGLGFHLGMQMTVTCHGLIGFAAMVAKDVRAALEVTQQFIRLQSSALGLRLEVEDDTAYLYFDQVWPDYSLGEVGPAFMMLGFSAMGDAVSGQKLVGSADVAFEQPAYFHRFEHLLPGTVRFGQPHTRLKFPASYLDLPLIMADPLAARLAREQCKRALNALVEKPSFSSLVRDLIYDEELGFFSMEEVAEKLHVSARTLQRQLAEEDKTFSDILDELRQQKSITMLKRKELSLEQIAEALGYTDVTNFSRAFKRWTGKTPGKYFA